MRIYKLRFLSALHVDSKGSGEPETAEEFIRSDTLSAALCLAWSDIFPAPDFLHPPFRLSSAFPYIGNTLLFPIPLWQIWEKTDPADRKKRKKIRWISQSLLEKVLGGKKIRAEDVSQPSPGIAFSAAEKIPADPFWKNDERQRVSVDRLGMQADGGLFFFGLQFFAPECGLWFAADVSAEKQKQMRAALDYLGDTGIGADRNSGLGHFTIAEEKEWTPATVKNSDGAFLLSLYNPAPPPEENLQKLLHRSAYGLNTRSGWVVNSTLGRPPIRVFTEGSCFSGKPKGRVVEMLSGETKAKHKELAKLPHSAPRDFRALFLPCKLSDELREVTS
ncbi:MAG: type III-A CRISPR-associated RAMP protein Csm4 [Desulfococcaceae bacterium]|jgi:CRISPR-associated protein Csm4|nr:type III-A CRISPR-associated RAMP protein Csm4 [Desulfococcaceae bacterium]